MTIYLVRHAKAGDRSAWTGDDFLRPLSRRGQMQAEALLTQFAGLQIDRLLSSPYVRCVETLAPLGEHLGLEVELRDELGEGAGAAGALALVDAADAPMAICSHGDVIGSLVEALDRRGVPRDDDRVAKGST